MTRYLLLLHSYGLVFVGRPLTRGRVCLLHMLLALASAVFLGSESLGTRDQICDFPFRRLLRLAGSRWKYSTPPSLGGLSSRLCPTYNPSARINKKHRSPIVVVIIWQRSLVTDSPLSNGSIRHNIFKIMTLV
jgi:hypothetical protein